MGLPVPRSKGFEPHYVNWKISSQVPSEKIPRDCRWPPHIESIRDNDYDLRIIHT